MRRPRPGSTRAIDQAMDVARDVIDRRINALGTLEPTIIRQGSNRILVQVPGLQDPEALKALIGRTARLEFKLVCNEAMTPEQLETRRAPVGNQILPYGRGRPAHRVQRRAIITGDHDRRRPPGLRSDRTARPASSPSASTAPAAAASPG